MRYLELIASRPLVWSLFFAYLIGTSWLAWLGHRRTKDMKSYAIGGGAMNPIVVGITLAASIASTATFVINPGFVYAHGVSALIHFAGAAGLGVIIGLVSMSFGFRRFGARSKSVTLPQWIGERFGSRGLALLFAAINLLSLSFVVLIIGALSIVMQQTLGLSNVESLILIVTFVFGYVFLGGTYAHAYTNTLQGIVMVVVSVVIVGSGLHLLTGGGLTETLRAQDPNLLAPINPASSLFGSFFSVYVSGFVIGFALVCQPHILTKALYVEDDRAVRRYLLVTIAVNIVFASLLLVGLYARVRGLPADIRQDQVMAAYLASSFSPEALAFITVALLAAGMSTLDGILVALSSIAANDLFLNVVDRRLPADMTAERRSQLAHRASQIILIAMGAIAFVIALSPPKLLGIFGQIGVYGIVAASAIPIAFGIFVPSFGKRAATASALVGLATHFALYLWGSVDASAAAAYDLRNPGVTATYAIFASLTTALVPMLCTSALPRLGFRRRLASVD